MIASAALPRGTAAHGTASKERTATWLPLFLVLAGACATTTPPGDKPIAVPVLRLDSVTPSVLLPGSAIVLRGAGFVTSDVGIATVRFRSTASDLGAAPKVVSSERLEIPISPELLDALGGAGNRFVGQVIVRYEYGPGAPPQEASIPVAFDLRLTLTPRVDSVGPEVLYVGSALILRGAGFLAPDEGGTRLRLDGVFQEEGAAQRAIQVELTGSFVSRDEVHVEVTPELFGISPGSFTGTAAVRNTPVSAAPESAGDPRPLVVTLGPAAILSISPVARRGQRLVFQGRGFLPKVAEQAQATVLRFDGDFTERGGKVQRWRDEAVLELIPEYESGSSLSYVLRVFETPGGALEGLGLVPGTFEGRVTPLLVRGAQEVAGLPLTTRFELRPVRQVIYLKYLPGFTDALRQFGLRNVELHVRERILAVCRRDYARWNLEFRATRPTDYVEYGVVEIGGRDPNARGLFGLDNTTGKDLGNLRLNDVIGGFNAETEEQGFLAFGGVFLESFLSLSDRAADPLPIASPRFDQVFDAFRPDRGGDPVGAIEYPSTERKAAIDEAIRVLGNLVGTTLTHEIGHTLGMAVAEGFFHNPVPAPNQIMDSGADRSFEERAELDGQGPAVFSQEHQQYLDSILPPD